MVDRPEGGRIVGRIVEVEAYDGETDRASHARFGRTARNAVMYGEPGLAYLYLVYGMHTCLNVVTEPLGRPAAVLIRAVEVLAGETTARALRLDREANLKRSRDDPEARVRIGARIRATPRERLASGPGLVGAAFGLDRSMTGLDLCDPRSSVRLEADPTSAGFEIVTSARVGIAYAGEPWTSRPWRFAIAGSGSLSGPRAPA